MFKLEEHILGFLIFAILFPHTLHYYGECWQHVLTLPSSPVGKSPDLHVKVQDTIFFYMQMRAYYSHPYFGLFFYLVCRYLENIT